MQRKSGSPWRVWTLGLTAMGAAFAVTPSRAAPDSGYQVEIIVFERDARGAAVAHEGNDRNTAPPDYSNALTPGSDGIGLLAPAHFQLMGAEQKLKRSGRTPLVHTGWVQKRSESRAVRITSTVVGAGDAAPIVDGAARLKVGELLNIGIDFSYRYDGEIVPMAETRTVKFGELHYFDGDQFGVLVQVTRASGGE